MALNPKTSVASRNLALNAAYDVLNGGSIKFYDGTQPTDADTAIGAQVLLLSLALNATAFAAASGGSKSANAIGTAAIGASGTATWFRLFKSDGTTAVADGSVGTATANAIVPTVTFTAGVTGSCSALTITMAA